MAQNRKKFILLKVLRFLAISMIFITVFFTLSGTFYMENYYDPPSSITFSGNLTFRHNRNSLTLPDDQISEVEEKSVVACPEIYPSKADIDTFQEYQKFDFQPSWIPTKTFWSPYFDHRAEALAKLPTRPPLKVIIVPHSHTDPGWLQTFEDYYSSAVVHILDNLVENLIKNTNFTFIWSEISFLNLWWEDATEEQRNIFCELVKAGRVEIVTGGWVMTDEATTHVYGMLDQLIEGHQWVFKHLNILPRSGWSIDPFGYSSTMPYLLSSSGIQGLIIQRIHFAWKYWFAYHRCENFIWIPEWIIQQQWNYKSILTHNLPFDIYSIGSSSGPNSTICGRYDFLYFESISLNKLQEESEILLNQYMKLASLTPHNVALVALGNDFRYRTQKEWTKQYTNYQRIINYINSNFEKYRSILQFGTIKDYFNEISERYLHYPTLKGDFFVYADIFTEGRAAYWSGYYTTRPYYKVLFRQLMNNLRNAEILYTLALSYSRRKKLSVTSKLDDYFKKLVKIRRNYDLFHHHDASPGTAKQFVMADFGIKLHKGIESSIEIQRFALQTFLLPHVRHSDKAQPKILLDWTRKNYNTPIEKVVFNVINGRKKILIFNSIAQLRQELIMVKVNSLRIKVVDENKHPIEFQVNPIWERDCIVDFIYEVVFLAKLQPLSVTIFEIIDCLEDDPKLSSIHTNFAVKNPSIFNVCKLGNSDILISNYRYHLYFDYVTGFMKAITRPSGPTLLNCAIHFGAYRSDSRHSGAYLFKPKEEIDILAKYKKNLTIIVISGQILSRITVQYGNLLKHSVTLLNSKYAELSEVLYLKTGIDFGSPFSNQDTEMFMRICTDIRNGEPPIFYTDLNGFEIKKRIKIEQIGIEGNYYPINTMIYIEDKKVRMSLLTDHAQGGSSLAEGFLEVMLERRTLCDDSRGLSEGICDSRETVHKHLLLFENFDLRNNRNDDENTIYSRPSLFAHYLSHSLIYPINIFYVNGKYTNCINRTRYFLTTVFPTDINLVNLRTLSNDSTASNQVLLILHRPGYNQKMTNMDQLKLEFYKDNPFVDLEIERIEEMSITGLTSVDILHSFRDIHINPMDIRTYKLTFKNF